MTCAGVLVRGDHTGNYRNNGTYTHTSTHSYNQSILKTPGDWLGEQGKPKLISTN